MPFGKPLAEGTRLRIFQGIHYFRSNSFQIIVDVPIFAVSNHSAASRTCSGGRVGEVTQTRLAVFKMLGFRESCRPPQFCQVFYIHHACRKAM